MMWDEKYKRVVFVPMDRIGDAISDTPALSRLKKIGVEIVVLATSYTADIFENNPNVLKVIRYSRSKKDGIFRSFAVNRAAVREINAFAPDAVLGMMRPIRELRNIYSGLNARMINKFQDTGSPIYMRWVNFFNSIGVESGPGKNEIYPDENDIAEVSKWFLRKGIDNSRPIITVHTGAAVYKNEKSVENSVRYWPRENYIKLFSELPEEYQVVLTGVQPSEIEENSLIRKQSPLKTEIFDVKGIRSLAYLIAVSKALITLDTGTLHIASATNTPITALFGPTSPDKYGPFGKNLTYVMAETLPECWPCDNNATCGGDNVCMKRMKPVQVYKALMKAPE